MQYRFLGSMDFKILGNCVSWVLFLLIHGHDIMIIGQYKFKLINFIIQFPERTSFISKIFESGAIDDLELLLHIINFLFLLSHTRDNIVLGYFHLDTIQVCSDLGTITLNPFTIFFDQPLFYLQLLLIGLIEHLNSFVNNTFNNNFNFLIPFVIFN